ncbi:hypothetical protein EPUL_006405, partial [Erysiphe pulchra]
MEDIEGFIKRGEAQSLIQYASRSSSLQSDYFPGLAVKETLNSILSGSTGLDGDPVMGGMKIDIDTLASLIARINGEINGAKS